MSWVLILMLFNWSALSYAKRIDKTQVDICKGAMGNISHANKWERLTAVQKLGSHACAGHILLHNKSSLHPLLKALSDNFYMVRIHAIASLTNRYSNNSMVQGRIAKMLEDKNKTQSVKIAAIGALSSIKRKGHLVDTQHHVKKIASVLSHSMNSGLQIVATPQVRIATKKLQIAAIRGIGIIGTDDTRIHNMLAKFLEHDIPEIRTEALMAFIKLPNVRSAKIQRKIASRAVFDSVEDNRLRALFALENMRIEDKIVYFKIQLATTAVFSPYVKSYAEDILLDAKQKGLLPSFIAYPSIEQNESIETGISSSVSSSAVGGGVDSNYETFNPEYSSNPREQMTYPHHETSDPDETSDPEVQATSPNYTYSDQLKIQEDEDKYEVENADEDEETISWSGGSW